MSDASSYASEELEDRSERLARLEAWLAEVEKKTQQPLPSKEEDVFSSALFQRQIAVMLVRTIRDVLDGTMTSTSEWIRLHGGSHDG